MSNIGGSNILNSSNSNFFNSSMNPSSSKIGSTSGSKLVEVRSVPFLSRKEPAANTLNKDRMGSPININNYINIYTNKTPKSPFKQKISLTSPAEKSLTHSKNPSNTGAYGNYSYDKTHVGTNSYKNAYQIYGGSSNGSV